MPLTHLHVLNVCKIGTPEQCMFLHEDELDRNIYFCLKLSSQRKYVEDLRTGTVGGLPSLPKNDNCKGYPILRYKNVGYDEK
jgi:hypothetical protein